MPKPALLLVAVNNEGKTEVTHINPDYLISQITQAAQYLDTWNHDPDECGADNDGAAGFPPCTCGLAEVRQHLATALNLLNQTKGV